MLTRSGIAVGTGVLAAIATLTLASPPLEPVPITQDQLSDEGTIPPASDGVTIPVTIDDPTSRFEEYYADIERVFQAAAGEWASHLDGNAVLELRIAFEEGDYLMASRPMVAIETRQTVNGFDVYRIGTIWEILGDGDPNGQIYDGEILIAPSFLPLMDFGYPEAPAADRYDAYSIFLHELGHVLGFSCAMGYYDASDVWATTYDIQATQTAAGYSFTGDAAVAAFGDAVPLSDATSPGTYPHVDMDAVPDSLMVPFVDVGWRLNLGSLELAILEDSGMPIRTPCASGSPDADLDRQPDCADGCPNDPAKTQPGTCGCGVADTDSDGDGVADCDDTMNVDVDDGSTNGGATGDGSTGDGSTGDGPTGDGSTDNGSVGNNGGSGGGGSSGRSGVCGVGMIQVLPLMLAAMGLVRLHRRRFVHP
jgi:uncharacterized membrane protein YgcG